MRLGKDKKDRITEQVLHYLYRIFPDQPFTADIAREVARDEEFIKRLLFELQDKDFVVSIRKNKNNELFSRRIKWRLSNRVYEAYKSKQ